MMRGGTGPPRNAVAPGGESDRPSQGPAVGARAESQHHVRRRQVSAQRQRRNPEPRAAERSDGTTNSPPVPVPGSELTR